VLDAIAEEIADDRRTHSQRRRLEHQRRQAADKAFG
jgi:hypothetical protein